MSRPLLAVLLAAFLVPCLAQAQNPEPVPGFGERLGPTIEPVERTYFGLFPSVDDFRAARLGDRNGDTVEIVLTLGQEGRKRDSILPVSMAAISELQRYAASFEKFSRLEEESYEQLARLEDERGKVNWRLLRGMASPEFSFEDQSMDLCVVLRDGRSVCGPVVFIDESVLILYTGSDSVEWKRLDSYSELFHPGDIEHVYEPSGVLGGISGTLDIPMGGNDTVYREVVRPYVGMRVMSYPHISPEIAHLIERHGAGTPAAAKPVATVDDVEQGMSSGKVHLSVSYGRLPAIQTDSAILRVTSWSAVPRRFAVLPAVAIALKGSYSLTSRIRVGLGYEYYPAMDSTFGIAEDYDLCSGSSITAMGDVAVIPRGAYFTSALGHIEVLAGIGLTLYVMNIESRITDQFESGLYMVSNTTETPVAITARGAAAYYLSRNLAVEVEARWTPEVELRVDKQVLWSKHATPFMLKTIDAHSIQWHTSGTRFSVRYCF